MFFFVKYNPFQNGFDKIQILPRKTSLRKIKASAEILKQMATQRDREILNAIVNPLLPVGEAVFDDADQIPVTLQDEEVDNTEEYK